MSFKLSSSESCKCTEDNKDITSQPSSCLLLRQSKDRISLKNNQIVNERVIGNITRCLINRKVKDSDDATTDEKIPQIENKIRACVLTMTSDLNQF